MAVTKRTRYEVLRRDDYTCRYCRSQDESLTVDHVVPSALGGTDAPSNLVACCKGLTSKQLIEATSIAVSKRHVQSDDVFRYVAGIARNKLIELDEATKAILTGQVG